MIRSSKHAVNISIPTHTLHYPAMKWINSTKQFHHLSVRSLCQLEPSLCMASNQWSHPLNKTQQNSSIDQKVDHHWMVDFTLVTIQQAHTSTLKFLKKATIELIMKHSHGYEWRGLSDCWCDCACLSSAVTNHYMTLLMLLGELWLTCFVDALE